MTQLIEKKQIRSFISSTKGLNVCILAGVHGNETDGINAIQQLHTLNVIRGTVSFITVNKKAIQQQVRFIDENLNRCFIAHKKPRSYEAQLAQELKHILKDYDICLDLHNSNAPKSEPFIICESNAHRYIASLPITKVVSGFDTFEPGGTDYYMNNIGKVGICVECGSVKNDGVDFTTNIIQDFLNITGNIQTKTTTPYPKEYYELTQCYVPKGPFVIDKPFADFEKIKKNQIIGYDQKQPIRAQQVSYMLFGKNIPNINTKKQEGFLLARKKHLS